MNTLLIYLLKVVGIQAILYLIYNFVFHKSGRHSINRFYLILALILSFVIPILTVPAFQLQEETVQSEEPIWYEIADMTSFSDQEAKLVPVESLNESSSELGLIGLGLVLVSLTLLIRLIWSHLQLIRLKKQSNKILKRGLPIYCSTIDSPFSYFNSIFIPKGLLDSNAFDIIINHELVHVKKRHSIDRVLMEVVIALIWFNPFHYFFRNRLIETHEFQADEEAIAFQNDPIHYQEVLYQQLNSTYTLAAANHFKLNTIKTRIKMINKNKKHSKWHYLLILPVLALMTFSFANKENAEFIAPLKNDVSDVLDYAINPSNKYTPSIFPLKDADDVKLTSSFGMRMNPLLKVETMHDGVDFKTESGNPVLATADGEVVEAGDSGPYGNKIVLKHEDIYLTSYAHLSEIQVEIGDRVKRGEVIGASGNSGKSTGPHLHYEVKNAEGEFLDPINFINNYNLQSKNSTKNPEKVKLGSTNRKLRVVIDPGHGGKDFGIKSSELSENEVALKVANQVAENFINSDNIDIILTRSDDKYISLEDRVEKTENSDLFISLHIETHEYKDENSMLAIYNDQNDNASKSKYFSELLAQEMKNESKDLKVGYSSGYYVLKNAKCPAVLFSMGYFSNPESEIYLNSEAGMNEIARELSDAIIAVK